MINIYYKIIRRQMTISMNYHDWLWKQTCDEEPLCNVILVREQEYEELDYNLASNFYFNVVIPEIMSSFLSSSNISLEEAMTTNQKVVYKDYIQNSSKYINNW